MIITKALTFSKGLVEGENRLDEFDFLDKAKKSIKTTIPLYVTPHRDIISPRCGTPRKKGLKV